MKMSDVTITRRELHGVHKDLIPIALKAVEDYGWKIKRASSGGFDLICSCGEHRAYLPTGKNGSAALKGISAKINRCPSNKMPDTFKTRLPSRDLIGDPHLTTPIEAIIAPTEPVVVSEKPHLAKRNDKIGGALVYPSKSVIEQTWSDGRITYRCTMCDYGGRDQFSSRSVSSHYAGLHSRGKGRQPQEAGLEIPVSIPAAYTKTHHTYNPSDRLVQALADALRAVLNQPEVSPEEAAIEALVWLHDRPDLGDPEDRMRDPLTDEQIVSRIRGLVDGGRYAALETQISLLQTALEQKNAEYEVANERANRLAGKLTALAEAAIEEI